MSFEKSAEKIERLMNSIELVYAIRHHELASLNLMLGTVSTDLTKLENGEEPEWTEQDVVDVSQAMNFCKRIILDEPITETLVELVKAICLCVHNWNINVAKDGGIHKDVKFINNAIDGHYTIVQAIEVLKRLIQKGEHAIQGQDNINCISEHYLRTLDKIHGEKKCEENICV